MQTQWYLCEIDNYPAHEGENLKTSDNLSVEHPEIFTGGVTALLMGSDAVERNKAGEGQWYVWLPIIPRVGDTLQFSGWQVEVSRVILETDWTSETGIKEEIFVSATINIRDDVVPKLADSHFAVESINNQSIGAWYDFARRGHDLQYYAWELKHESYRMPDKGEGEQESTTYYRWHTRIRPVTGDIIEVQKARWHVTSVELASANNSVDGWLTLEPVAALL